MANEILYSGLGDLRLAAVLAQEIDLLLADRGSLWGHPAIRYVGDQSGRGSTAIEVPLVGYDGYDRMSAPGESTAASNVALTDASPQIVIARQHLRRQISDLALATDSINSTSLERLALDMVGAASMRFTELICNVTDDFTTVVGSTGVNMSVDDWYSAMYALELASVPGPFLAILHPRQLADFQESLRAEGGAAQWFPATAETLKIKGQGYVGNFLGVDIFKSSLVPTANAGADRAGCMIGYGAVGYADMSVPVVDAGTRNEMLGKIKVEFSRDTAKQDTLVDGVYYVGVAILQDAMGVSIVTDA